MSLASNDLLKTISGSGGDDKAVRMAVLTGTTYSEGGRKWLVRFFGEETASTKPYLTLGDTSLYAIGRNVLMIKVNGSYVIGGIIS